MTMWTPRREAEYRERTDKETARMTGVSSMTFLCRKCGQSKSPAHRKQMVKGFPKYGYKCAECAGKSAAESADKNKASVTGR